MPGADEQHIIHALGRIPSGRFVLTCAHDGRRTGVLVHWVQQCSNEPPMVMVALPRGLPVEPLIRSSRGFAVCQIADDDPFLRRKFAAPPPGGDDPFVALQVETAYSGAPIIKRAMSYVDCELVRHVELDADTRLHVGRVHAGKVFAAESSPAVHFARNGLATPAPNAEPAG